MRRKQGGSIVWGSERMIFVAVEDIVVVVVSCLSLWQVDTKSWVTTVYRTCLSQSLQISFHTTSTQRADKLLLWVCVYAYKAVYTTKGIHWMHLFVECSANKSLVHVIKHLNKWKVLDLENHSFSLNKTNVYLLATYNLCTVLSQNKDYLRFSWSQSSSFAAKLIQAINKCVTFLDPSPKFVGLMIRWDPSGWQLCYETIHLAGLALACGIFHYRRAEYWCDDLLITMQTGTIINLSSFLQYCPSLNTRIGNYL